MKTTPQVDDTMQANIEGRCHNCTEPNTCIHGHKWTQMDTNGHQWTPMDTNGHKWTYYRLTGTDMATQIHIQNTLTHMGTHRHMHKHEHRHIYKCKDTLDDTWIHIDTDLYTLTYMDTNGHTQNHMV